MASRSMPWKYPGYVRMCAHCDNEFHAHHHRCIYCSDECAELREAKKAHQRKRKLFPKPHCKMCNRIYVREYPQQKYCPRHNR